MQRYDSEYVDQMMPDDGGNYVRYDDAQARITTLETENALLREAVRVLGAAASQLAGALRLDAMVQDDGSFYGTTRVALDCYEEAVNTNPIAAAAAVKAVVGNE